VVASKAARATVGPTAEEAKELAKLEAQSIRDLKRQALEDAAVAANKAVLATGGLTAKETAKLESQYIRDLKLSTTLQGKLLEEKAADIRVHAGLIRHARQAAACDALDMQLADACVPLRPTGRRPTWSECKWVARSERKCPIYECKCPTLSAARALLRPRRPVAESGLALAPRASAARGDTPRLSAYRTRTRPCGVCCG